MLMFLALLWRLLFCWVSTPTICWNAHWSINRICLLWHYRGWEGCLLVGHQRKRSAEVPAEAQDQGRHRVRRPGQKQGPGGVLHLRSGQVPLRSPLQLAGQACQQDPGHYGQEELLHRCVGHRRIRDLWGMIDTYFTFLFKVLHPSGLKCL